MNQTDLETTAEESKAHRYRPPLQLTISTLFIILVVIVGGVLSWQNYNRTSEIILNSADQLYRQIAQEVTQDFRGTYFPVATMVRLLALSPVIRADSLDDRLTSLRRFSTVLQNAPSIAGIQVGYGNGDYFIVRSLDDEGVRRSFRAPAAAYLMADHITTGSGGERTLTRIFFDLQLSEVAREAPRPSEYDPRVRPWYKRAITARPLATYPYLFHFIQEIGTTIALKAEQPEVVVAADVTLRSLSKTLAGHPISEHSEALLIGAGGSVLAYPDTRRLQVETGEGGVSLPRLADLGSPVLTFLSPTLELEPGELSFQFEGKPWQGSIDQVGKSGGVDLYLLMVSPVDELLSEAIEIRRQALANTALIILITIPIVWYLAKRLSDPMRDLARAAGRIRRFDFSEPIRTRSFISEVDQLAVAMEMMKQTINRFLELINSLAGEQDFESLLGRINRETLQVSQADAVLTYLLDESDRFLQPSSLQAKGHSSDSVDSLTRLSLEQAEAMLEGGSRLVRVGHQGPEPLVPLLELLDVDQLSIIALPLHNRKQELIGLLCLVYRAQQGVDERQQQEQLAFVRAMSGFAAVSLESRELLMMQEALFDAFIELIAGAIDAKSPYTGGHCQRVPELTLMLARAAEESEEPPFTGFRPDPQQKKALKIASWLHDCGKVTTPEYVVDKATKLEGIHDRIHEIRMRFEVLKRDAMIAYWQQLASGDEEVQLKHALQTEWRQLDEEFAFVAECNQGGEYMAPERMEKLRQIGERRWMRTLDDRAGISHQELERKQQVAIGPLPAEERLLDDKPEHLFEREPSDQLSEDNPWGFQLDVPEYKYNRGELYNLGIERGTLTAEERYVINDHIVQTIKMLEKLPYPRHLHDVPLIAGSHHETMDGRGYPRRLTGQQMPLTARMMAIADIFEALTASDRPYKKPKRLSEAVGIMGNMVKQGHIDPDLFRLFLEKHIYWEYADRFLQPEQRDEVDLSDYL